MESNDSLEIPDRRETSDIPGLPSRVSYTEIRDWNCNLFINRRGLIFSAGHFPFYRCKGHGVPDVRTTATEVYMHKNFASVHRLLSSSVVRIVRKKGKVGRPFILCTFSGSIPAGVVGLSLFVSLFYVGFVT